MGLYLVWRSLVNERLILWFNELVVFVHVRLTNPFRHDFVHIRSLEMIISEIFQKFDSLFFGHLKLLTNASHRNCITRLFTVDSFQNRYSSERARTLQGLEQVVVIFKSLVVKTV